MQTTYCFVGQGNVGAMVDARMRELGLQKANYAADAEVVFSYFATQAKLEDAFFAEAGLVQGCVPGTLLIDLSPATPAFARELAAVAVVSDLLPVEAPLVVVDPVAPGALSDKRNVACFVAGDEDAVEAALPLLRGLCDEASVMAGAGSAQLARASYTLQMLSQLVSAVESEALYRAVRATDAPYAGTAEHVGAATPLSEQVLEAVAQKRFEGEFTVEMLMGEVSAAIGAADDAEVILPQAEACQHMLELLAVVGGSDLSPAALSLVYGDEAACAEAGLDWARAEAAYGLPEGEEDYGDFGGYDDEYDFGEYDDEDDVEPCGCGHDHGSDRVRGEFPCSLN